MRENKYDKNSEYKHFSCSDHFNTTINAVLISVNYAPNKRYDENSNNIIK